jgi:hypothetical protein
MTTTAHGPVNGARFAPVPGELRVLDLELEGTAADVPAEADVEIEAAPSRWDRWVARAATVKGDWSRWWLRTVSPPPLVDWWQARTPRRVPDDNDRLRFAWWLDFWLTGLPLAVLSVAGFLTAAGVRWVACHPARRWLFLTLVATTVAMWHGGWHHTP